MDPKRFGAPTWGRTIKTPGPHGFYTFVPNDLPRRLDLSLDTVLLLSEADRAGIDGAKALELMAAHPSLIKRPVVEHADKLLVGFDPDTWSKALA